MYLAGGGFAASPEDPSFALFEMHRGRISYWKGLKWLLSAFCAHLKSFEASYSITKHIRNFAFVLMDADKKLLRSTRSKGDDMLIACTIGLSANFMSNVSTTMDTFGSWVTVI